MAGTWTERLTALQARLAELEADLTQAAEEFETAKVLLSAQAREEAEDSLDEAADCLADAGECLSEVCKALKNQYTQGRRTSCRTKQHAPRSEAFHDRRFS